MDAKMEQAEMTDINGMDHSTTRDGSDSLIKLSTAFKEKAKMSGVNAGPPSQKRDWSSALDLVNEAFEAIQVADQRALAADAHRQQLQQLHRDQLVALEARIAASEKRADAAEAHAKEAESWLAKFHDTIVDGFQKTFVAK